MFENGYIDEATYEVEVAAPLRSVQNGDFQSFRTALPPRDYESNDATIQYAGRRPRTKAT